MPRCRRQGPAPDRVQSPVRFRKPPCRRLPSDEPRERGGAKLRGS
jgi:hypothetical protein